MSTPPKLHADTHAGPARLEEALDAVPVIGILRGCPPASLLPVAAAAADAGLRVIEVTLDSPSALDGIARLAEGLPGVVVGAGTVRTAAEAHAAAEAGAAFIVAPITAPATLAACRDLGMPSLPGAATPTEIRLAEDLGAFAVKVFPAAQLGGPEFVRAVLAPLGKPRLVPTGGVDPASAAAYLSAGAYAVGIGGGIFGSAALAAADTDAVAAAVARCVGNLR
jgi:2-dehydro-3-deoxyphosphogluconate aldolase/(4S)-4-hydroxy-2-oxoglutarate aldolase